MIRHLFKIIWNERKLNGWIIVEYTVVFCILWFCADYLCYMVRNAVEPLGFDIENTYMVRMGKKLTDEAETADPYEAVKTFTTRIVQHPAVESVGIARSSVPYGMSTSTSSYWYEKDSIYINARLRWVTSGFFDVYRIPVTSGRVFNWEDEAESKHILISPDRDGFFNQEYNLTHRPADIQTLYDQGGDAHYEVIGHTAPVKDSFLHPYKSSIYFPLDWKEIDLSWSQIVIRVSPNAGKDFADRFIEEMRDQLNIGPYFLITLTSSQEMKKNMLRLYQVTDSLNSVYAITFFLIMNIFLGIIGTFWYRTQSRRSEIGLRFSMGATPGDIKKLLCAETLLLLFVASIIAVNICINVAQTDLLNVINIPKANRQQLGVGVEQDFINYGLTFLFLGLISLVAVWYPARQASRIPPAEALKDE